MTGSLQVPTLCVLVSSVLRLLVYAGTCDTEEPSMVCTALKSTHEGGEVNAERFRDVSLNLVTYHLIFAITGLVFCCLNAAINIVFYFVQSKVIKHNNVNYCFSEDDISDDAWKLVDLDIFVCCRTFCCLF